MLAIAFAVAALAAYLGLRFVQLAGTVPRHNDDMIFSRK